MQGNFNPENNKRFGDRLKYHRERAGLSRAELTEAINCYNEQNGIRLRFTSKRVFDLEQERAEPNFEEIIALSRSLYAPLEKLAFRDGKVPNNETKH